MQDKRAQTHRCRTEYASIVHVRGITWERSIISLKETFNSKSSLHAAEPPANLLANRRELFKAIARYAHTGASLPSRRCYC